MSSDHGSIFFFYSRGGGGAVSIKGWDIAEQARKNCEFIIKDANGLWHPSGLLTNPLSIILIKHDYRDPARLLRRVSLTIPGLRLALRYCQMNNGLCLSAETSAAERSIRLLHAQLQNWNDGARKLVFAGQIPGNRAKGKQKEDTFINFMGQLVFSKNSGFIPIQSLLLRPDLVNL